MSLLKFVVLLAVLPACAASINSARAAQTKTAKGWFCKDEPIVDCRGGCSEQSDVWRASCGNKRYRCQFDEERVGARMTSGHEAPVFRSVSCQADQ